ncbi:hypothetical protein H0H93_002839 [Arthromyces matolae]|nr:hypothetical protein H0H93_002839 [Arthromyces matolae]
MSSTFTPTTASIPPLDLTIRLRQPSGLPVHIHPLNPLDFLLRAAQIYPDKVALVHPDVEHPVSPLIADAHHGVLAARAVLVPINTRLKSNEVAYILEHSGARLILVDHEYTQLIQGTKLPFIVSNDTGRSGDPYETFLSNGRRFSHEKGWQGLDAHADENAPSTLCYTSGTTGRPKGVLTTLRGSYLAAIANAFEGQITKIGITNDPLASKPPQAVTAIIGVRIAGAAPTPHLIAALETLGMKPVHVYGLTYVLYPASCLNSVDVSLQGDLWSLHEKLRARLLVKAASRAAFKSGNHVKADELIDVPRDGKTLGEIVTRGNITMKEYFNDPEATAKAFRGGAFRSGDLAVWYPDGNVAIMDRSKDIIISGGENASSLAIEQELATHPDILEVTVVARSHPKWGERPMAFVVLHPQHAAKWVGRQAQFSAELKGHARKKLPGFACPEWVEVVQDLPVSYHIWRYSGLGLINLQQKTSTGKILKSELRKTVAKL